MKNEFNKYATKHLGMSGNTVNDYTTMIDNGYGAQANMTPYILEEREMRVTQMDIFSRLMMDRIIWVGGQVDDRMSKIIQAQVMFLATTDDKAITLHLDSPGGSVMAGLSIIDVMEWVKPDVNTINTGMCASMGSVLLAAGDHRASLRFSKVMTHQVSHGTQGNVQDTRISQMEAEKYNYLLFQMLGKYAGKSFDEVLEFSRRDRWYTANEAKEFGLIDEVLESKDKTSVEDYLKGFDAYYQKEVLNGQLNGK